MLPVLILALATPLFVPATPTPSPLPEIGRVRSNTLCVTLRRNIAPSVVGLMKNDEIIGAGHRAFAKMSHDLAGNSPATLDIDKLYLTQVETRLVHNLKIIDEMLAADDKRFPASPRTDDERDAVTMRGQLLAVADEQRRALDLVSGTLETEALGQMQHGTDSAMQNATAPTVNGAPQSAVSPDPTSFLGSAGLPEYTPLPGVPTTASKLSNLGGHTIYDQIAAELEGRQNAIAQRERVATSSVVSAVNDCRASSAPVPVPVPSPGASPP